MLEDVELIGKHLKVRDNICNSEKFTQAVLSVENPKGKTFKPKKLLCANCKKKLGGVLGTGPSGDDTSHINDSFILLCSLLNTTVHFSGMNENLMCCLHNTSKFRSSH